jgi:hypothetical protein
MSESATASIVVFQLDATHYNYAITVSDTGTTPIGTFWFSWVPGQGYLPDLPSPVAPTGWSAHLTDGPPPADGYSIQWVAGQGAALQPGQSLGGLAFTTVTSPSTLFAPSTIHPSTPVTTTVVYSGGPFSDAGFTLAATQSSNLDYSTAPTAVYVDLAAQFAEQAPVGQGWSGGPSSLMPASTNHFLGIQNVTGSSLDDLLVGGTSSGTLSGGDGNDLIYGNTSQATADNASKLTLDGGAGTNALYGSSGFNTFIAGDANGGFNQIWGAASKMASVPGYANNTVSFAGVVAAGTSVYVDLLNGHDAYIHSGPQNGGSYTLEDAIANVPNVIGSSGGDVVIADNGVDRITGGGGADQLYAGSGAGSQDTFVYTAYGDSNLVNGYDTIVGFKIGTDKIDVSALHSSASHLLIQTSGTANSIYLEATPGSFNAATDLAIEVNTTMSGGLHASDFVFGPPLGISQG